MSRFRMLDLFSSRNPRRKTRGAAMKRRVPLVEPLEGRWLLAADLAITKADDADTVAPGSNITYTINITNNGPDESVNVGLSDTIPTNTNFVSFTAPAGWSVNTPAVGGTGGLTASIASMPNGATAQFQLVVQVNPGTALDTTISNLAFVAASTSDFDFANNSDIETTLVAEAPSTDLEVVKTDSVDPVVAGTDLTYTITVRNLSSVDAASVELTDVVPVGTTFVSLVQNTGPAFTLSLPAVGGTGTSTATIGTLAAGAEATFTAVMNVNADTAAGFTINNTAAVVSATADVSAANNIDTETTTVSTATDLAVVKSDSPDSVVAGGNITYTIDVTNNGPSDAQTVELTDLIPANTTFVSLTAPAGWTLSAPAVGGTGSAIATIPTLAADASASFTLVVNVNPGTPVDTSISNTVTVTTATTDTTAGNNSDTETSTVVQQTAVDLEVVKNDDADPVVIGNNVAYTVTVRNVGTAEAQNVTLTDLVPTNTTFVSASAPAGWSLTTPAVGSTGTISAGIATLAAGGEATFTFVVNVDAGVATGTSISNTATATTTSAEANLDNNVDTEATTAVDQLPSVDLEVVKTDLADPILAGNNLTYTITVRNLGTADALNVQLSDLVPAGTTFVSLASPAGWSSTTPAVGGTGTVSSSIAALGAGAVATFTLVVNAEANLLAGSTISNSATVTTTSVDANSGNNTEAEVTDVAAEADLSVTKTDSPDPVQAGGNLTYTVIVSNSGPSDAQNVLLSDLVPANTTFVSLTAPAGWVLSTPAVGGTGTASASLATLAAGQTATLTFVVNVNAGAADGIAITNTATVVSATADANTANNTDVETSIVQVVQAQFDFGDAPDSYGTLLASDGARHTISDLFLGATVDAEIDGQPSAGADADGADEDGVSLAANLIAGLAASAVVDASAPGLLDAWIDFDGSGTFDADEQIAFSFPVEAGVNDVGFTVPTSAVGGTTYARFRISSEGGLDPTGAAADGEVEDYVLGIEEVVPGQAIIVDDPLNPGESILLVTGTDGHDHIIIEPRPKNKMQVRVKNTGKLLGIFSANLISRIVVLGLGDNDTIFVNGRLNKPTELHGNEGNDTLIAAKGADLLFGEEGNDTLIGKNGNDVLIGGSGNDVLNGGNNNDQLFGEAGNDVLIGANGNDDLFGDEGDDVLNGGGGHDLLVGGSGDDVVVAGGGNDQLFGEEGNDLLKGDAGHDVVIGGTGSDKLHGGSGRDLLIGGEGRDDLFGQGDDDILIGGSTDFDEDAQALADILAEWTARAGFDARIANVEAFLNDGTVFDDGDEDQLIGAGGRDWYLDFELADNIIGFSTNKRRGDRRN